MYNRLFTKILDSSIWLEADTTRIVWITLLAAMDEDGFAPFSCDENLSRRANVPIEALQRAILILESPDQYNPNDEFAGRRIEKVQGGWMVLKAPYYRSLLTREIAREQTRLRVQKHRAKNGIVTNPALQSVTDVTDPECNVAEQSIAEQSTTLKSGKPTLDEVKEFLGEEAIASEFFDYYESNGWRVGRNAMKDWKAAARRWKRNQKPSGNSQRSMSAFEIEKRVAAITVEINKIHKQNGGRVEGDGIDDLKKRRDELQRQLVT